LRPASYWDTCVKEEVACDYFVIYL
jgi:hypothetical protein